MAVIISAIIDSGSPFRSGSLLESREEQVIRSYASPLDQFRIRFSADGFMGAGGYGTVLFMFIRKISPVMYIYLCIIYINFGYFGMNK